MTQKRIEQMSREELLLRIEYLKGRNVDSNLAHSAAMEAMHKKAKILRKAKALANQRADNVHRELQITRSILDKLNGVEARKQ